MKRSRGGILTVVLLGVAVATAACGGGAAEPESKSFTPKEALYALQTAGYVCDDPDLESDSLGCMRPAGEAGWWTMKFTGAGQEYASLSDYLSSEGYCASEDLGRVAVYGANWVVVDGGGSEDQYFVNHLDGKAGVLGDICPAA